MTSARWPAPRRRSVWSGRAEARSDTAVPVAATARRLVIVDHAKNNLSEIDLELRGAGQQELLLPVITDSGPARRSSRVPQQEQPIVFHAAA